MLEWVTIAVLGVANVLLVYAAYRFEQRQKKKAAVTSSGPIEKK
ncbi:hypothetical protein [Paenibacillus cymbidii]|nr:hypothetical protein [Paenibacillus cymbidii]